MINHSGASRPVNVNQSWQGGTRSRESETGIEVTERRPPRVAMVGTRGLPPRYGGFEAALGEIVPRLTEYGYSLVVYSRGEGPSTFGGARLVRLPGIKLKSLETLSHSFLSLIHCLLVSRPDVIVLFNAANAPLLWLFPVRRVIVHVDGLEWRRTKWGRLGRFYYQFGEWSACKRGWAVVADALGIRDYYADRWKRATEFIPYGAELVSPVDRVVVEGETFKAGEYYLVVARFEPENHVLEAVKGYAESAVHFPLIVVGHAPYSNDYIAEMKRVADSSPGRVMFTGGVWDQALLDDLYAGARAYIHGHSVGGTNPSLLRACGAGAPVIAWDVPFNREVLGGQGRYFACEETFAHLLREDSAYPWRGRMQMPSSFWSTYNWVGVGRAYADLIGRALSPRIRRRARLPSMAVGWRKAVKIDRDTKAEP